LLGGSDFLVLDCCILGLLERREKRHRLDGAGVLMFGKVNFQDSENGSKHGGLI
jgi:hypothetical protein